MFRTIDYLQDGSPKQKKVYKVLKNLNIMADLEKFSPILCGTIPIQVDIEGSDLDIIMNVDDYDTFERKVKALYGHLKQFRLRRTIIRNNEVIKANFIFQGFDFELFAQPQDVELQHAYLHMVVEHELLTRYPTMREQIIALKQEGSKTELAFCKVLGLETEDPYLELLGFGRAMGFIK